MIDQITLTITRKLLEQKVIDEKDIKLYQYSLRLFVCFLLNYSAFFAVGLIMDMFWENFAMIITFSIIRKFSGGYHADRYIKCFLSSIVINLICLIIIKNVFGLGIHILMVLTFISFILISVFSPVEHKNKGLNVKEKKIFKIISIILSGMFLLMALLLVNITDYVSVGVSINVGIILSSVLMMIGWIKLKK